VKNGLQHRMNPARAASLQLADFLTENATLPAFSQKHEERRNDLEERDVSPVKHTGAKDKRKLPQGPRLAHRVAQTIAHLDRDALGEDITCLLMEFLQADVVSLYALKEIDDVRCVSLIAASASAGKARPPHEEKPWPLADQPEWAACVLHDEVVQTRPSGDSTLTLFPIREGRSVQGVLSMRGSAALSARDVGFVHGILRILQSQIALLDYGQRDTLTGLLNRKTFESHFEKLRKRAHGPGGTAPAPELSWLGLMDIDRFKSINDTYGHLFGDEVLLLVSQLMKHTFRGADQLFRFGGEEFLVVLDRATPPGAAAAFERLRASIEAHAFPQIGRVTVSLGFTTITPDDGPTVCVERADTALYYAKEHGRNCIGNYEALLAEGKLVLKQEGQDAELF
jgi:diguanylate cyclase (GGDEF)-like protein